MNKLGYFTITSEAIVSVLRQTNRDLPEDAIIVKIIPSPSLSHDFDIVFHSDKCYQVAEGAYPPRGIYKPLI
jgi:hypothetical protein